MEFKLYLAKIISMIVGTPYGDVLEGPFKCWKTKTTPLKRDVGGSSVKLLQNDKIKTLGEFCVFAVRFKMIVNLYQFVTLIPFSAKFYHIK